MKLLKEYWAGCHSSYRELFIEDDNQTVWNVRFRQHGQSQMVHVHRCAEVHRFRNQRMSCEPARTYRMWYETHNQASMVVEEVSYNPEIIYSLLLEEVL